MVAAPAKAPKPATGYAVFLDGARAAIIKEIGSSSVLAISAAAYGKWKELGEAQKAQYEEKAKQLNTQRGLDAPAPVEAPAVAAAVAPQQEGAARAAPVLAGARKADSDDDAPLTVAAKKAQSLSGAAVERADSVVRKASSSLQDDEPLEKKAKKEKKQEKKEKKEKKENQAVKKTPAKNTKKVDESKNPQATTKFKAQVDDAVKEYMKKEPDWTLSMMQEELAEEHSWESDSWLKTAVRATLNALGISGNSAAVPQKVAAWY